MNGDFLDPGGEAIAAHELALPRAQALSQLAGSGAISFVRLIGCRRFPSIAGMVQEAILLDLDVERGQLVAHDIRHTERVAAIFRSDDATAPEVLALRPDFPSVPHLNLRLKELPRCLCLYDRNWSELALRWTPAAFVERIRQWLALTARGELHQDDQPLEPLLFGSAYRLILPADLFERGTDDDLERLDVRFAHGGETCRVLLAERPVAPTSQAAGAPFVATSFVAHDQAHGHIRRAPANLGELHDFVASAGVDLLATLRQRFRNWLRPQVLDAKLIFVVAFPLSRSEGARVESVDLWAFLTGRTLSQVGVSVGAYDRLPGGAVGLLLAPNMSKRGEDVPLDVLTPHFAFSRAQAARASGQTPDPCPAVAVGIGALGSQVVQTLARSGFGRWTVVDEDDLLPHNLSRHALAPFFVGHSKAVAMALQLNQFYKEDDGTQPIHADVQAPGDQLVQLEQALAGAEVILDMAASVPVSRHLALDAKSGGRRIALFLNPQGTDLILLAEDAARTFPLDCLEMQYYRAAATEAALAGHLAPAAGQVRYARSCRDVSAILPAHLVGLHAAIGAHAIRQVRQSADAGIQVWRADPNTLAVTTHRIPVPVVRRHRIGDWTIVVDDHLLTSLQQQRAAKLPNETGGVLVGAYDFLRRMIYVVETLPSPPDSRECPDLYIRGCEGLAGQLANMVSRSGGQLEYIGEWHSHPDNCSCAPSTKDIALFGWLAAHLGATGQPALMAILCQGGMSAWFIGTLEPGKSWEIRDGA